VNFTSAGRLAAACRRPESVDDDESASPYLAAARREHVVFGADGHRCSTRYHLDYKDYRKAETSSRIAAEGRIDAV
jgi:hypothetical protein